MDYLEYVDVKKMEYWLGKAKDDQDDSVLGFICVWIAFNYYYGNFFEVMYPEGSDWRGALDAPMEAQWQLVHDRDKLRLLAEDELFSEQWDEFRYKNQKLFSQPFKRPVCDSYQIINAGRKSRR